jgi:hypothetical protein
MGHTYARRVSIASHVVLRRPHVDRRSIPLHWLKAAVDSSVRVKLAVGGGRHSRGRRSSLAIVELGRPNDVILEHSSHRQTVGLEILRADPGCISDHR